MKIPCPMCLENEASRKHTCSKSALCGGSEQCECCKECSEACQDEFDPEAHEEDVIEFWKQLESGK